jgi:hypothetical protein
MTFGNMPENVRRPDHLDAPASLPRVAAHTGKLSPPIAAEDGRNRLAAALIDGEDFRDLPLADRKRRLAKLLGRRRLGIVLSEHKAKMRMAPRSSDRPAR